MVIWPTFDGNDAVAVLDHGTHGSIPIWVGIAIAYRIDRSRVIVRWENDDIGEHDVFHGVYNV